MDFIKKLSGDDKAEAPSNPVATEAGSQNTRTDQSGSGGGLLDKMNNALGGGAKGEKKEDGLDKALDWVQEHILKQGPQTNESAVEQAKDEAITDTIRKQFKQATGHEFPVADK
ncbi:hypothetical protein ACEPAH_7724 [Sanghuangporus vaninii]